MFHDFVSNSEILAEAQSSQRQLKALLPYDDRREVLLTHANKLRRPLGISFQLQPAPATMAIVYCTHRRDRVKPTYHIGGTKRVSPLGRPTTQLLDQAYVTALVTPRFVNVRRLERHARQPWAQIPVTLHLVSANESLRHGLTATPVQIRAVRRKVGYEVGRWQRLLGWPIRPVVCRPCRTITQINVLETVPCPMLNVSGHVHAKE